MTRGPCCADEKADRLKKGPWTPDEDQKLVAYIQKHGHGGWRSLPLNAGLQRCGKSCRLRWTNYLRPDIKRGRFSPGEDQMIVHLHAILGNRWSAIASHLPCRTDNEIKNYWNTHLKKRLRQMGIDPVTHTSTTEEQLVGLDSIIPGLHPVVSSNLTHMSQWDSFRAEAEARLSGASSGTSSDLQQTSSPLNNIASAKSPNQGSPSTTFMTSWKAQVAETLRPSFGMVELDKTPSNPGPNPVNLQTFLQNWESSLQRPAQAYYSKLRGVFSTCGSPIDVPDFSSDISSVSPQYDAQGSNQHLFPPSELTSRCIDLFRIPGNIFSLAGVDSDSQSLCPAGSTFNFAGICGDSDTQFSPTSTSLHAHSESHDSSSHTNSPCGSSGIDGFDLLAPSTSFPYHDGTEQYSRVPNNLVFPQGSASFWCRQRVAMADALYPEPGLRFSDRGCTAAAPVPMLNAFSAFGTQ